MVMMNSRYQLVADDPTEFAPRPIRIQTGSNSGFTIPASAQPAPAPVMSPLQQAAMQPQQVQLPAGEPAVAKATNPIVQSTSPGATFVNGVVAGFQANPVLMQQGLAQGAQLAQLANDGVSNEPANGGSSSGNPQPTMTNWSQTTGYTPPQQQAPAQRPMSFELQKLLNHYGVVSASKPGYSGAAKPTSGADDYQALLDKYNTDNNAYTDWANQYDQRMQTPMYGPGYQGAKLQPLQYPNGYQAPTATTPTTTAPPTGASNPLAPNANADTGGNSTLGMSNGFTGDPNSYTGGLLNAMIGQDPWGVPVSDLSTYSSGAMAESAAAAQAAADAGLANQAAAGMTGFGGVGTDSAVAGFGGFGVDAGDMGSMSNSYGGGMGYGGDSGGGDSSSDGASGGSHSGDSSHGDAGAWAHGGLVALHRKYAAGGMVEDFGGYGNDPSVGVSPMQLGGGQSLTPQLRQAILRDAQANGIENPTTSFTGARGGDSYGFQETLPQMAAAYDSPEMQMYTQEYQAARQQAAADRANFEKLLQAQLARKDETGPSKEEMYFQLAAAFGAPTKTGSFGESLAGANTVLAGHQKGIREANLSARDRKDKLALEVAKYRADGSKDDLTNLRTLTVEEMKALRQNNLPLSEAGKMVYDTGRRPGQPGYAEAVGEQIAQVQANKNATLAVQQGNASLAAQRLSDAQAAAKLLTPAELKLKTETEDTLAAAQSAMNDLDKAFVLNQNAYDNSAGDWVAKTLLGAAGSEDPKLVNTREMNNLLTGQGLTRLRATFGGNPTEGERAILLELQGIGSKSQPEREAIMKNAYRALKTAKARQEKRLADINSRAYREVTPPTIVEAQ